MKTIKLKKDRLCDYCGKMIIKGDFALFDKSRIPKFINDKQSGILYVKNYLHLNH